MNSFHTGYDLPFTADGASTIKGCYDARVELSELHISVGRRCCAASCAASCCHLPLPVPHFPLRCPSLLLTLSCPLTLCTFESMQCNLSSLLGSKIVFLARLTVLRCHARVALRLLSDSHPLFPLSLH